MEVVNKYPNLFHKYILNISDMKAKIEYTPSFKFGTFKENICHLHIYDISKFDLFFGHCIDKILEDHSVIVTYSLGTPVEKPELDILFIKVRNRGYDIGGKICAIDYLYKMNVEYKYILFLHSKTDRFKRERYFRPLIAHIKELKDIFFGDKGKLGVFPNTLWINHNGVKNYRGYDLFKNNELYLYDMFDFIGVEHKNQIKLFAEGNCMALHKKVIDFVFRERCQILYNALNEENSFDYNWFITYYKKTYNLHTAYREYKSKNMFGNNSVPRRHADGMIEHVFERIWINAILQLGGEYVVFN